MLFLEACNLLVPPSHTRREWFPTTSPLDSDSNCFYIFFYFSGFSRCDFAVTKQVQETKNQTCDAPIVDRHQWLNSNKCLKSHLDFIQMHDTWNDKIEWELIVSFSWMIRFWACVTELKMHFINPDFQPVFVNFIYHLMLVEYVWILS